VQENRKSNQFPENARQAAVYWPSRRKAVRARREARPCPAATTNGWSCGGPDGIADQISGRSQPSTVRTQDMGARACRMELVVPSTRHESVPTPTSRSVIPTINRITCGARCAVQTRRMRCRRPRPHGRGGSLGKDEEGEGSEKRDDAVGGQRGGRVRPTVCLSKDDAALRPAMRFVHRRARGHSLCAAAGKRLRAARRWRRCELATRKRTACCRNATV
jgi:hypothetical protein